MTIRKRGIRIAIAVAVVVFICIYAMADPGKGVWFPKCPFYAVTGLQCPGCGSQRAIHALLHGHLSEAFRYNALLVASIPVLALLSAAEIGRKRHPRFYAAVNGTKTAIAVLITVTAWWILRNVIGI